MALSKHVKLCPQCKDEQKLCVNCGDPIAGHHHKKMCDDCGALQRKIIQKHNKRGKKSKEKYTFSDRNNIDNICNYDCFNCEYSECLLPVDKEDLETGRLFK